MTKNELMFTARSYVDTAREFLNSGRALTPDELRGAREMLDRAQKLRDQAAVMDLDAGGDPDRKSEPLQPGGRR